ncbi:hypothetical protein FT663_04759 [Candidozyma haemuli var. vulneris]|uniref:Ribonuclease P protein subunit n=1 Tax=Candidozyma haemuli TaxID=45357 RepID=A0A2V1B0Y6_9ASCO|nr:hypothetical protein CXQ85_003869 [[Candida] haemuloni]KAF3986722.1 hypothetical protein FT663_04759 [[Candida] haemuloni var. vulneris]KAF3987854.1 hypothetical protein FT662_03745 [[Candida] haemuloni var. vulneris]PVH23579.1 hypothetical protein CXQ85_003869 [[Candida] haemuloni]
MDRDLTLEKHLLSRSFDSESEIVQLLESRYSVFGGQKPFIPLVPTEGEPGEEKLSEDGLSVKKGGRVPSERKKSTRAELKRYIKSTLGKQKRAVRSVQHNPKTNVDLLVERLQIPRYSEYTGLHSLWNKYMADLLFGENKTPSTSMVLPKLSTADYNGCIVRVLESRNRNMVGIEGIVVYDAQHSFIVVVPQKTDLDKGPAVSPAERVGGLRVLAKKGSLFGFDVETDNGTMGFTIMGSRFEHRSTDRSGRKFKAHNVDDIL